MSVWLKIGSGGLLTLQAIAAWARPELLGSVGDVLADRNGRVFLLVGTLFVRFSRDGIPPFFRGVPKNTRTHPSAEFWRNFKLA